MTLPPHDSTPSAGDSGSSPTGAGSASAHCPTADAAVTPDLDADEVAGLAHLERLLHPERPVAVDPWNTDPRDRVEDFLNEVVAGVDPFAALPVRLQITDAARSRLVLALQGEGARARKQWGPVSRAVALVPAKTVGGDAPGSPVWAVVTEGGEVLPFLDSMIGEFTDASPLLGGLVPFIATATLLVGRAVQALWVECWLSPQERRERATRDPQRGPAGWLDAPLEPEEPETWGGGAGNVIDPLEALADGPVPSGDPATFEQRATADALFGTLRFGRGLDASLPSSLQHPAGLPAAQRATTMNGLSGVLPPPEAIVCYTRAALPGWPL